MPPILPCSFLLSHMFSVCGSRFPVHALVSALHRSFQRFVLPLLRSCGLWLHSPSSLTKSIPKSLSLTQLSGVYLLHFFRVLVGSLAETSTEDFDQFLEALGDRVTLCGFQGFLGGLDNKNNRTGTHSFYTTEQDCEVMFHVSTMLPFAAKDSQQVARKRYVIRTFQSSQLSCTQSYTTLLCSVGGLWSCASLCIK
jgi:hypothetical protein